MTTITGPRPAVGQRPGHERERPRRGTSRRGPSTPTVSTFALPRSRRLGRAPLALCLHGFPDSAWTWRHLLPALAAAGYRAVAPLLRGYAPTAVPADGRYQTARRWRSTPCALHDALGGDGDAVLIGHDWGALAAYARGPRTRTRVAQAGHAWPCRRPPPWPALLHLRPAAAVLVHVLLPAPAGRHGGADGRPGVHRPAVGRLVARLRRAEDLPHVKDALRDPANLAAALGYYRATLGGVGVDDPPGGGGTRPRPPPRRSPPVPARRDDGCMGAELAGAASGV